MVTFWTETFLIFWIFMKKKLCKKKKVSKNCFDKQEKSWTILKMFREKCKNLKAISAVWGHSKTKIFSVGQPWWPKFFRDLVPLPNHFIVATALQQLLQNTSRKLLLCLEAVFCRCSSKQVFLKINRVNSCLPHCGKKMNNKCSQVFLKIGVANV